MLKVFLCFYSKCKLVKEKKMAQTSNTPLFSTYSEWPGAHEMEELALVSLACR